MPSKNNTRQQVASCFASRCFAIHQPEAQKLPRRRRREMSKHLSCNVLSPPISGVEPSPLSRPASSRLSLHRILPSQPFKAPETCLTSRPRGSRIPDRRDGVGALSGALASSPGAGDSVGASAGVCGGKKCQGIHCLFSTCYYSGPNQPASQSGASGHLETLLCL